MQNSRFGVQMVVCCHSEIANYSGIIPKRGMAPGISVSIVYIELSIFPAGFSIWKSI